MAIGLYFLEDMLDFSVWADDEGGPGDAHDLLAIHILLLQNAVGNAHFLVGVGQESEGERFFVSEFSLRAGSIWGDAKQHGARLLNLSI